MSTEPPGDRYTLKALIDLYHFNPELRDLLVEGSTDAGFYAWFASEQGLQVEVYAVDSRVWVEADTVLAAGLEVGAKGRAIAVGLAAEAELGDAQSNVTVVVDADWDRAFGRQLVEAASVFYTDLPSLESYAFIEEPMRKFLRVFALASPSVKAADVVATLAPALALLHATRALLHTYGIRLVDNFVRAVDFKNGEARVSVTQLIDRSVGGRRAEVAEGVDQLKSRIVVLSEKMLSSSQHARGHDLAPLLRSLLRVSGGRNNDEAVEGGLRSSLSIDFLMTQPLFVQLTARLA